MARKNLRTDIINSGLDLIHQNGFSASGVAAIAEASASPKGSFYNHFKSKDEFCSVILDHYFEDVIATLNEMLFSDDGLAIDRVRNYFVRLRNYNSQDNFERGCLIGNISAEVVVVSDATRAKLDGLLSGWTKSIAACLENGQLDGSVRCDVPATKLAGILLDGWQGALLRAKVERSSNALDNFIDLLLPNLVGKQR